MCDSDLGKSLVKEEAAPAGMMEEKVEAGISCNFCKAQNPLSNLECSVCGLGLFEEADSDFENKVQCEICGSLVKKFNHEEHYKNCRLSLEMIKNEEKKKKEQ